MARLPGLTQQPVATQELQTFLSDLGRWTSDVREKDKALLEGRTEQAPAQLPPVRGRAATVKADAEPSGRSTSAAAAAAPGSPKKQKTSGAGKPGSAAGHTYDHFKEKWFASAGHVCCWCMQLSMAVNFMLLCSCTHTSPLAQLSHCPARRACAHRETFDVDAALREVDTGDGGGSEASGARCTALLWSAAVHPRRRRCD